MGLRTRDGGASVPDFGFVTGLVVGDLEAEEHVDGLKKRGTCTTARFGSEVDTSQSGGKTAALHSGSAWRAVRRRKLQNNQHLRCGIGQ